VLSSSDLYFSSPFITTRTILHIINRRNLSFVSIVRYYFPDQYHWHHSHLPNTTTIPAMLITRGFSLTNFVIGSSALGFQIFVLYPWHEKLEAQFKNLTNEHESMLKNMEAIHQKELSQIRKELELLNKGKR
jgi:hypothetical protein